VFSREIKSSTINSLLSINFYESLFLINFCIIVFSNIRLKRRFLKKKRRMIFSDNFKFFAAYNNEFSRNRGVG
jgi:hypothetical protein